MSNIREVSRIAGVSVATVSRALQKPDVVAKATREKVEKAVREAGYKPNMMARNFRSKRSYTIMVLVPNIANPFLSRVISGIQRSAKKRGYHILLGDTEGDRDLEREFAAMVHSSQADGIIQLSARFPFDDSVSNDNDIIPIVNACECLENHIMPTVELDNLGAAEVMVNYFISQGHKHIALVTGPLKSPLTKARRAGYDKALKDADIEADLSLIVEGDFSLESGRRAASTLLAMAQPPSAIFCMNDEMAIGAIQRIKKAGLTVPGDISVAGFDDIAFAGYCDPPLTTISQPAEEFGSSAVALLCEIIDGKENRKRHLKLPYELVIRESVALKKD